MDAAPAERDAKLVHIGALRRIARQEDDYRTERRTNHTQCADVHGFLFAQRKAMSENSRLDAASHDLLSAVHRLPVKKVGPTREGIAPPGSLSAQPSQK